VTGKFKKQIKNAKRRIRRSEKQISGLQDEVGPLEEGVDRAKKALVEAQANLREVRAKITDVGWRIHDDKDEIEAFEIAEDFPDEIVALWLSQHKAWIVPSWDSEELTRYLTERGLVFKPERKGFGSVPDCRVLSKKAKRVYWVLTWGRAW